MTDAPPSPPGATIPAMTTTALDPFRPLLAAAKGLDLGDPAAAKAELERRFDPKGEAACALENTLKELLAAGEIANRGELPVRWGRVTKASEDSAGFSIDVVLMTGPGPRHRHPAGEVNYCIAIDGEPTFDAEPPGWVVKRPDSTHIPTVAGGTMLIAYLLPEGAIEFLK